MILTPPDTPFFLRNGNADTIAAKFLQRPAPTYRRELLPDSTGKTKVAYDFSDGISPDAPLVVLFHGLEGSSRSHYAVELMLAVRSRGWHGAVVHFRSCGGIANTAPVFYHLGDTAEIAFTLDTLAARYREIYAVGVSLGGNALPQAAAVISAPVDAEAAGRRFDSGITRLLYTRYFLRTLIPKARTVPGFQTAFAAGCKTLGEFDDRFTAPLHGFADRHDYYRRTSCKPLLKHVAKPLLLLNAANDPFLPPEALPRTDEVSEAVTLFQPAHGGHVGFVGSTGGRLHLQWLPQTVLSYFDSFRTNSR
ncbi:TPA: alpha/beta fold hydrolase [Neisseria meningitidis]